MRTATLFAFCFLVSPTLGFAQGGFEHGGRCTGMMKGNGNTPYGRQNWTYSIDLDRGEYNAVENGGERVNGKVAVGCGKDADADIFLQFLPDNGKMMLCRLLRGMGNHYEGECFGPDVEVNLRLEE